MPVSGGSSIRKIGLRCISNQKCMLVSDQACRSQPKHVGLQWVFNQTCRSLMGHVGFRWVSNEACLCLRSGMSVSDGSPIGLLDISDQEFRSLMGLRQASDGYPMGIQWVSNKNNIFVNSYNYRIFRIQIQNNNQNIQDIIIEYLGYNVEISDNKELVE